MTPWIATDTQMPDEDETVLMFEPDAPGEPVWTGFVCAGAWYYVDGEPAGRITHWMHFPDGPDA